MSWITIPVFFVLGAMTWSLSEYVLHRGFGHRKSRLGFSKEHMAHHRDAMHFAPTLGKMKAAGITVMIMAPVAMWIAGWTLGAMYTGGFLCAYTGYEVLHRRIHTHAPLIGYGRWMRRHHYYHHFSRPNLNHGVTSPLWDLVFGTYATVEQVRVPRKKAMVWLCDETGSIRAEYAQDYVLVGRRPSNPQLASIL